MNSWDYDVEMLAANDAFRRWVISPDPVSDAHWQRFLHDHPGQHGVLNQARRLVLTYPTGQYLPSERAVERMWAVIERAIR